MARLDEYIASRNEPSAKVGCVSARTLVCVNPRLLKNRVGDNAMAILLALVFYFAIWVLVIWGSTYFNQNVV
jgi:hypothetical protein